MADMRLSGACGLGIDILELARFSDFLVRNEEQLTEIFTQGELLAADDDGRRELYLATRWALKEAVLKALGTGWGRHVEWTDVEAVGDAFGPRIVLHGAAEKAATGSGTPRALGSASASGGTIIAMAVLAPAAQPDNR